MIDDLLYEIDFQIEATILRAHRRFVADELDQMSHALIGGDDRQLVQWVPGVVGIDYSVERGFVELIAVEGERFFVVLQPLRSAGSLEQEYPWVRRYCRSKQCNVHGVRHIVSVTAPYQLGRRLSLLCSKTYVNGATALRHDVRNLNWHFHS